MCALKRYAATGDAAARALVKKLLRAGCQPYFRMLEKWLAEGLLDDPFQEFMVCCDMVSACAISIHHSLLDVREGCWSAWAIAAWPLLSLTGHIT